LPLSVSCKHTGTVAIKSFLELHSHAMYTIRERERESENEGNSEKYEKQYI
jgi:hypothetical protein